MSFNYLLHIKFLTAVVTIFFNCTFRVFNVPGYWKQPAFHPGIDKVID